MSMSITQIFLAIAATLLFLAITIPYAVNVVFPQSRAMLEGIIPSLTQAEKLSLEQGFKAIHVRLATASLLRDFKLFEFHPTNEGALGRKHHSHTYEGLLKTEAYFFLNRWTADKCTLFTTSGTIKNIHSEARVYYFNIGAQIRTSDTNLKNSLFSFLSSSGCENKLECNTPGEYVVCNGGVECDNEDSSLIKQDYGATADNCLNDEKGCPYISGKKDCCAFAKPDNTGTHQYKPAYNILCGNEQGSLEAKWYACTGNQSATVEANGAQFTCNKGEWKVKSGSGIQITPPQLKYEFGLLVIDKTNLEFVVVNNQDKDITNVKVSAKVSDPESSVDCLGNTPYANSVEKTTASIAKNGGSFLYSHDNFCWKAKTFDVSLSYADGAKDYKIECKNADINKESWQKCISNEVLGSSYNLGASFSKTCSSKRYDIKYEGAPSDAVLLSVKENENIVKQGTDSRWTIKKGTSETINSIKVTLYDVSATSPYAARIGAECV